MLLFVQNKESEINIFQNDTLMLITTADNSKCTSVWSVHSLFKGGLAVCHVNEAQKCISCSLCKSRNVVNAFIFDQSGGRVDILSFFKEQRGKKQTVFDEETGDVGSAVRPVSKPKDLRCISTKKIPVPRCIAVDSEDNEYYRSKPLEMRGIPSELRFVYTHL